MSVGPPPEPLWIKILVAGILGTMPGVILGKCSQQQDDRQVTYANQVKLCSDVGGDITIKRDCILPDGTKLHWTSHYTK